MGAVVARSRGYGGTNPGARTGADVAPIEGDLDAADGLIGGDALPSGVAASSSEGQAMIALAADLDEWNDGLLTDGCD